MVAVISSGSLGIYTANGSERGTAGAAGSGSSPDQVYVNTSTGNLVIQNRDELLASLGMDLVVVRTYNSQGLMDDDNGDNWRLGMHQRVYGLTGTVNTAGSTIRKVFGDGSDILYTYNTTLARYVSTDGDGAHDSLSYNTTTSQWTWTNGSSRETETYNSSGQLLNCKDEDGNTTSYTYTGSLLTSIADASGQTTTFTYSGNNLTQIQVSSASATQTRTRYTYDTSNRLTQVTVDLSPSDNVIADGKTYVTTYTYVDATSKRIASITQGDGTTISFTYEAAGSGFRVKTFTDGAGRTTTYNYSTTLVGSYYQQTDVTDALGRMTSYLHDSAGRLTRVLSPVMSSVRLQTDYAYDGSGNLTTITEDPSGLNRVTTLGYDSNGNLTSMRDAAGNTVTRTYNTANQLLTEVKYLAPDPDGAGSGVATQPVTTRYVYDEAGLATRAHVRFMISSEGRVTEYQYSAATTTGKPKGALVATLTYTGATYTAAAFAESDLQTWAAAQDKTKLQRVDYLYDFREQLTKATAYVTTDSTGAGVAANSSVTQYVYDQRGLLLQKIEERGSAVTPNPATPNLSYATTFVYDGLGRVTSSVQWIATGVTRTTSTQYDDAGRRTLTTFANGLVATSLYNQAGDLVSVTNTGPSSQALGTTTYKYDGAGRLRFVTDATGIRQHVIYDEAGRKVAEIDADGTLTEYVYNRVGENVKTIKYADRLTATTLGTLVDASGNPANVALATLRSAVPTTVGRASDQITRSVYDSAGRVAYSIDETGAVTQRIYDGANRVTDVVQYASRLTIPAAVVELRLTATAGQLADAGSTTIYTVATHADDRRTRSFYDNDGNLVGTLDARGYLVESTYDSAGRLTRELAYANVTNSANWLTGTLSALRPALDDVTTDDPEKDSATYFFYDGQGRKIGELDAEGYLTETQYDVAGRISQVLRYDPYDAVGTRRVLSYTTSSTFQTLKTAATSAPLLTTQTNTWQYDGAGRVTQETNHEGTVTSYAYDSVGQLISTTQAAGVAAEARTVQKRYDFLGRVTQELSAENNTRITTGMTQAQIDAVWNTYGVSYTYDLAGRRIAATLKAHEGTTLTTESKTLYYYDDDGRVRFEVNALGERIEYQYNALGQLTNQITYNAPLTSMTGLAGGLLTSTLLATLTAGRNIDADANTTYTYRLNGQLAKTGTMEGSSITSTYNAFGEELTRVQEIDATRTLTVTSTYDKRGQRTLTQWDGGRTQTDTYDAFGRLTSSTDQYLNKTRTEYDRLGRAIVTYDALNNKRSVGYDAFSRKLTMTDALLNVTTYVYDDVARKVTVTTPEGVSIATTNTRLGQTLSVAIAGGKTTSYTYNRDGALTGVSDSLGALESRSYDSAGRLLTTTDANSIVTKFTYDAANRTLTRRVDNAAGGLGLTTTYVYDGQGRVRDVTDPNNVLTRTTYDRDGRVTQVAIDPSGLNLRTGYAYDKAGNVITVTEGVGGANPRVTQYTYDVHGRRTQELVDPGTGTNPATGRPYLNIKTEYKYDANGNLVRKIDARTNSTWYVYDANQRLQFTVDALGGVSETKYDAEGRVSQIVRYAKPLPNATVAGYAGVDRISAPPVVATSGADRIDRMYYDRDGREVYAINAMGGVTQRTFDANGNVTRLRLLNTPALTGTYANTAAVTTALGTAASTIGASDRVQWTTYDARGRAVFVLSAFDAAGLRTVMQTKYDGNGNVIAITAYDKTATAAQATDLTAMNTWATNNATAAKDQTTRFWFDAANREVYRLDAEGYLTETKYEDSLRKTTVKVYGTKPTIPATATTADIKNRANGVVVTANTAIDQPTVTEYDVAGRIAKITDAALKFETFTYDEVGNRKSFTNKKGATWNYEYDANGRMLEERSPAVDITTVTRNPDGTLGVTPSNQRIITRMTYDALGNVETRREGIRLSGTTEDASSSRLTTYGYDKLGRQTTIILPAVDVYNVDNDTTANRSDLQVTVTYDAFGDATSSVDVAGNTSYKVYDRLGRVVYEIDALKHVTRRAYDAFGNETSLIRYAAPFTQRPLPAYADNRISESAMDAEALLMVNSLDRAITKDYDRLNRVWRVTEDLVSTFDTSDTTAPGNERFYDTARPVTIFKYDAFGQVIRESRLIHGFNANVSNPDANLSAWAHTYSYYDRRGLKVGQVDAERYLTRYFYSDASGDLTRQIEFANRVASLDATGVTMPADPAAGTLDSGYDRRTDFTYDLLDRKISETKVGIRSNTSTGAANAATDVQTNYEYDAVGNQTRSRLRNVAVTDPNAAGAWLDTYSYYDALGRLVAVAEPSRDRGDGTTLIPLTLMKRDVYGNLVQQVQFARGATSIPGNGSVPAAATDGLDRTTTILMDKHGHAIQSQDATGAQRYAAFNVRGELGKEWQTVTNAGDPGTTADDTTDVLTTKYAYDALGRQIKVIEWQNGSTSITTEMRYNAFGEIDGKAINRPTTSSPWNETFEYDKAGRMWRTNSGDGAYKIYLYDLAGRTTAELKSPFTASVNLGASGVTSANAHTNAALLRTETVYDLMGRTVEQRQPTFSTPSFADPITTVDTRMSGDIPLLVWAVPSDGTLTYRLFIDGVDRTSSVVLVGTEFGYEAQLNLSSSIYDGTHTYDLRFSRVDASAPLASATGTFTKSPTTALSISPAAPDPGSTVGTVSVSGSILSWTAAVSANVTATLRLQQGSTVLTPTLSQVDSGGTRTFSVDLGTLGAGAWQYQINQLRGGNVVGAASGTFNSSGPSQSRAISGATVVQGIGAPAADAVSSVTASNNGSSVTMSWTAPFDGRVTATLALLVGGSWQTYNAVLTGDESTGFRFQVTGLTPPAGSYTYRITHLYSGQTLVVADGTLSVVWGSSSTSTTLSGLSQSTWIAVGAISAAEINAPPASVTGVWSAAPAPQVIGYDESNNPIYGPGWGTGNQVNVSWQDVGSGSVYIILDYVTGAFSSSNPPYNIGAVAAQKTFTLSGVNGGAALTWTDSVPGDGTYGSGGISSVSRIRIYDSATSRPLRDTAQSIPLGTRLQWPAPADTSYLAQLQYKHVSSSTWTVVNVPRSGSQFLIDLSFLNDGTYDYQIMQYVVGGEGPTNTSFKSGQFVVSGTSAWVASQAGSPACLNNASISGSNLHWSGARTSGDTLTVTLNDVTTGAVVATLTPQTSNGTNYLASLNGIASGTYIYRIQYALSGTAYLLGTGTVVVSTSTTTIQPSANVTQPSSTTYPIANIVPTASSTSDVLTWSHPALGGVTTTATLTYSINGGAQTSVNFSGPGSFAFASVTGNQTASIAYTLTYRRNDTNAIYAQGSGSFGFTVTTTPVKSTLSGITQSPAYPSVPGVTNLVDRGNGVMSWDNAATASGTLVQVRYRQPPSTGTWSAWANASAFGSGYSFSFNALTGAVEYEIQYVVPSQNPYRYARGTVSVSHSATISDTSTTSLPALPAAPRQLQTLDRWGNALSMTDTAQKTTNYRYNQYNQVTEVRSPQVETVSVSTASATTGTVSRNPTAQPISYNYYDVYGRLVGTRDGNGNVNQVVYNTVGQKLREIYADDAAYTGGSGMSFTYDAFNQLIQTTNAAGYRTRNAYDQAGRLVAVAQEASPSQLTGTFNGAKSSLPAFNAAADVVVKEYFYDQAGRRIAETTGDGLTGNSGVAETIRFWYDGRNNLVKYRSVTGVVLTYTFDAQGRKTGEVDGNLNSASWTYDYFGHLTGHVDLGGATYSYVYEANTQLLSSQTSTGGANAGQSKTYSYDGANHLKQINDSGVNRITDYFYDTAGRINRVRNVIDGLLHEDTRTEYDAMGRIQYLSGVGFGITYEYDAAGNRTHIEGRYSDTNNANKVEDLWYRYDSRNRVTISQGLNNGGTISIDTTKSGTTDTFVQGAVLTYDNRGNRATEISFGDYHGNGGGALTSGYTYDGLNRLTKNEAIVVLNESGTPVEVRFNIDARSYDRASRVLVQTTTTPEGGVPTSRQQTNVYTDDGKAMSQTTHKSGVLESEVLFGGEAGYDLAGNLKQYQVKVYNTNGTVAYTSTHVYNYRLGESYQESSHNVTDTNGGRLPGSSEHIYNRNGELIQFKDTQDQNRNRYFANNAQGNALTVVKGFYDGQSGRPTALDMFGSVLATRAGFFTTNSAGHFFYTNDGQAAGSFGYLEGKLQADFDVNYTPISSQYPGNVPSSYVVQKSETLRSVATKIFGDGSLWYILAEANGLSDPDSPIPENTTLTVPNQVVSLSNTANSFKPFNIADAIGDTTPTQPIPPPPKRGRGCGVLGMILVIIVAVVVTVFTAGVAAGALAPAGATIGTAAGATTVASASVWSVGAAALTGSLATGVGGAALIGTSIAAAAIGGAVGSIVSQGVGIAIGVQDGFSWKNVALGAIGAGVTAGLGATGVAGSLAGKMGFEANGLVAASINGVAANALTQGIAVATGLQRSFNWRDVAVSAVAAPVAKAVGGEVSSWFEGLGPDISRFAGSFAAGVSGSLVRGAFGGKVDMTSVLADAFGNALANSIVDKLEASSIQELRRRELAERLRQYRRGTRTEVPDGQIQLAQNRQTGSMTDVTPGMADAALLDGIRRELQAGLGDYANLVGVLGQDSINALLEAASTGRPLRVDSGSELHRFLNTMGLSGMAELTPGYVRFGVASAYRYRNSEILGLADDVLGAVERSNFDVPDRLLYVRDRNASKEDLRRAVIHHVGGRADAWVYQDLIDQVGDLSGSNRFVNISYGFAQSDARATYEALQNRANMFLADAARASLDTARILPGQAPQLYAGALALEMGRGILTDATFALDPLAPAALRDSARQSLFWEAALTLGPGAIGLGAKALRTLNTMARLNRFRSAAAMSDAIVDTAVARSTVFTNRAQWTATRPRGTGYTYRVVQRNDINWDMVRTDGPREFINKTNAEAARYGHAPQLGDGNFATLHHLGQNARGPLVEASTRYHGVGRPGNDSIHSIYGRNKPHPEFPIDRRAFNVDTREYWQWRLNNRN